MEREDIEKAAKSYQEKDHDIWTGKGMAVELQKAFKAGASWRIGSVWHPITIIPECYRLATEVEIDIWNQENHKKHRHYSLPRKKFVYHFCPFDKVLVRQGRNKEWVADWFSHITSTEPEERIYATVGGKCWAYCIPFDKSTADLVGSASDFEENE